MFYTLPKLLGTFFAFLIIFTTNQVMAAAVMSVGQDEEYSGKVMDRIVSKWLPPAQIKNENSLKVRVGLDSDGNVSECKIQKSSGYPKLDQSVCAAVQAGAPYGSPPYGIPAEIFLSFWSGSPKNTESTKQSFNASESSGSSDQNLSKNETAMQTQEKNQNKTTVISESYPENKNGQPVQSKYPQKYYNYLDKIVQTIRNNTYIPVESSSGIYYVTAQIKLDKNGKIIESSIKKSSGDKRIDKYMLQGIKRTKSLPIAPAGLGEPLDLVFKLVR